MWYAFFFVDFVAFGTRRPAADANANVAQWAALEGSPQRAEQMDAWVRATWPVTSAAAQVPAAADAPAEAPTTAPASHLLGMLRRPAAPAAVKLHGLP